MNWRTRLQAGSFRGVPFYTENATGRGGRRVAVHQYPQQEEHATEDLGRNAAAQTLEIYVVGDTFNTKRDALFSALDKPGSGSLIHPFLGALDVQMGEYSWEISSKKGGYCKITVDYTLTGKHQYPVNKQLSGNFLLDCCNNALLSFENDFTSIFSVLGYPAFVLQSAIQQLTSIPTMISRITQFGGLFGGDSIDVAEPLDFNALVTYPAKLSTSLSTLIRTENSNAANIDDAFSVYENLINALPVSATTAIYNTPSRKQQQQNQHAIDQLIKGVATVEAARTMADRQATFPNYSAAIAMQNTLLTALDHSIENGSDSAYPALANLQSAIIKRVDDIAPGLQRIEHIELAQSVPALVLAHQLYQTANNADELIARNRLAHPLFVPAGQQLEVLV